MERLRSISRRNNGMPRVAGMTFVEILIYLALFALIATLISVTGARIVRSNTQLRSQNALRQEMSFMVEKLNNEMLKAKRLTVFPDWGVVLQYPDKTFGYFRTTQSVPQTAATVSGFAFNYRIGYISLNCMNTATSSSCLTPYGVTYTTSTSPAEYSGWGWSPVAGWFSFNCKNRNPSCGTTYRVYDGSATTTGTELMGWAWNDVLGWVSFNCKNTSVCGTSNYQVIRGSDGYLRGYAWADEAGWVYFDGTGGTLVLNKGGTELPIHSSDITVNATFTWYSGTPEVVQAALTATKAGLTMSQQFSVTNHDLR